MLSVDVFSYAFISVPSAQRPEGICSPCNSHPNTRWTFFCGILWRSRYSFSLIFE